jgi:hypothetical protein
VYCALEEYIDDQVTLQISLGSTASETEQVLRETRGFQSDEYEDIMLLVSYKNLITFCRKLQVLPHRQYYTRSHGVTPQ